MMHQFKVTVLSHQQKHIYMYLLYIQQIPRFKDEIKHYDSQYESTHHPENDICAKESPGHLSFNQGCTE